MSGLTISQVRDLINSLEGSIGGSVGQWIASGVPTTPVGRAVQNAYRGMCRQYAQSPGAVQSALAGYTWADALCDPYLGNAAPAHQPSVPFQGGQCVGVRYRISSTATGSNGNLFPSNTTVWGPISSIQDGGNNTLIALARSASGAPFTYTLNGSSPGAPAPFLTGIARVDGLPDNCGNPNLPPRIPSGNPLPPAPTPQRLPNRPPGTTGLPTVVFSPDGTISIDLDNDGSPDLILNPNPNEPSGNPNNPGLPDGIGTDPAPGDPGAPSLPPANPADPNERTYDQDLVAVRVLCNIPPFLSSRAGFLNPRTTVQVLANLRFIGDTDDGSVFGVQVPISGIDELVPSNLGKIVARGFRVLPVLPAISVTVIPYFKRVQSEGS